MIQKLSVLVSNGNLGDNIIEKNSFNRGIERDINYLSANA
jgi:hypothetical protein